MNLPEAKIRKQEVDFYEDVFDFVKKSTKHCFKQFIDNDEINIFEIPEMEAINYDHWVCAINIKLDFANIAVKLHYRSNVARLIAANRLNMPPNSIPNQFIRDIIQEYLNLVMGQIKQNYKSADVSVTVPETTPTGDLDDPRVEAIDRNVATWKLSWPEDMLYFLCMVNLESSVSNEELENLITFEADDENDSGEMELF